MPLCPLPDPETPLVYPHTLCVSNVLPLPQLLHTQLKDVITNYYIVCAIKLNFHPRFSRGERFSSLRIIQTWKIVALHLHEYGDGQQDHDRPHTITRQHSSVALFIYILWLTGSLKHVFAVLFDGYQHFAIKWGRRGEGGRSTGVEPVSIVHKEPSVLRTDNNRHIFQFQMKI